MHPTVVIVGLGEVGKPLLEIMKSRYQIFGVDINQPASVSRCDVMHVCFPFRDEEFVGHVVEYINQYRPALTVINSTVAPGTTRKIAVESGTAVVHSPVRGKHTRMQKEMLHYVKFVGALDQQSGQRAVEHFEGVGMKTKLLTSPEASEIAKLTETTYFGLMIAWAQEVERYCMKFGASYDEVASFYDEIKFFPPVRYFPGVIGGHCVMPNIAILRQQFPSGLLEAIVKSNTLKEKNLGSYGWLAVNRSSPRRGKSRKKSGHLSESPPRQASPWS
jgi:UDP-N-acetyl-D-mannosaminuronate dehydrogenase